MQRRRETMYRGWYQTTSIHGNVSREMFQVRKATGILIFFLLSSKNNLRKLCWRWKNWTDPADILLSVYGCCFRRIWRLVQCILLAHQHISDRQIPKMPVDLYLLHIRRSVDWSRILSPSNIQSSMLLRWADIRHVVFLLSHTNPCMKTWGIIRDSWIYRYLW
jgi:hypothetical protein